MIRTFIYYSALYTLFLSIPAGSAQACLGPSGESQTFLTSVPEGASGKEVIAKVRIIEQKDGDRGRISRVRVIQAIKGAQNGTEIEVASDTHSCARDYFAKVGESFYIAADRDANGVLRGVWQGLPYEPYWVRR